VIFDCKWNTVSSSAVRMMIALVNCVLRRIFETREKETEYYVTRIACDTRLLAWLDE